LWGLGLAGRNTRDVMAELTGLWSWPSGGLARKAYSRHPARRSGAGDNRARRRPEHQAGLDELALSYTLGRQAPLLSGLRSVYGIEIKPCRIGRFAGGHDDRQGGPEPYDLIRGHEGAALEMLAGS
jgi:hypothetical protein